MDISAWYIGMYVRTAVVSALNSEVKYPTEPLSVSKNKEEQMTGKDHAARFREYLKHYKRPPVKKGGETHGD